MNSRLVPILIVLSLGVLLAGFCIKTRHHDTDLDLLQQKLQPLQSMLSPAAKIYFDCPPENLDLYIQARYLLAPRTLVYTKDSVADTVIYLRTVSDPLPAGGNTLWTCTDGRFHYRLTAYTHAEK